MTRDEYFKQQVEDLINKEILPRLKKREKDMSKEDIAEINNIGLFYSVDRYHPLQVLIKLARILTNEEYEEIMNSFKEKGYLY